MTERSWGPRFESLQEWWVNFLLQGQISLLTLIWVSVPPLCYCSSMLKILVILPKVTLICFFNVLQSAGLMIERSQVQIPAGVVG